MSQWVERVRNHMIWQELDGFGIEIDKALARESITSDSILALERLRLVLTYYGRRLAASDPALIPSAHLDSVVTMFANARTQISIFASSGDTSQLVAANAHADTIIQSLGSLPSVATTEDLTGINEAAANYHTTLASYLAKALSTQQELSQLSRDNQAVISQIRETLDAQKTQLATTLIDHQSQFSKAQDERASAFATSQSERLEKFSQVMIDHQSQFSSDQESRRTDFLNFERDCTSKFERLIAEYELKLKEHHDAFKQHEEALNAKHLEALAKLDEDFVLEGQHKLTEVERQKIAIEKLVGIIGNQGVSYGYQRQANIARLALYLWQLLTVLSLAGLIFVAFLMVFPGLAPSFQGTHVSVALSDVAATKIADLEFYRGLASRIFLSLTFGVFAAYAARQANRFMAIEQRNRKVALELQALGPFIEPLPEDEQHKFRIQIGDRSFGVSDHDHQISKDEDPVTISRLLKSKEFLDFFMERVQEFLKTGKPVE